MANKIKAAYMRAATCKPLASANWFAKREDTVLEGANTEVSILLEFPISIVTAIVSPNALPNANMIPPIIPEEAAGNTICKIASQRVAPKPTAA